MSWCRGTKDNPFDRLPSMSSRLDELVMAEMLAGDKAMNNHVIELMTTSDSNIIRDGRRKAMHSVGSLKFDAWASPR